MESTKKELESQIATLKTLHPPEPENYKCAHFENIINNTASPIVDESYMRSLQSQYKLCQKDTIKYLEILNDIHREIDSKQNAITLITEIDPIMKNIKRHIDKSYLHGMNMIPINGMSAYTWYDQNDLQQIHPYLNNKLVAHAVVCEIQSRWPKSDLYICSEDDIYKMETIRTLEIYPFGRVKDVKYSLETRDRSHCKQLF